MKRRTFIKNSSVVASALAFPFSLPKSDEKIKTAILGTGWWGRDVILANMLPMNLFEIAGICDVDSNAMNNTAKMITEAGQPGPKLFTDYRKMYEIDGLQAVVIATPTHWHALQFIDACEKGLHVFLEKPVSYDILEGRAMLKAHQKANNVVQVDFPRVMADTNSQVKDFIESGAIGKIYQVKATINNNASSKLVEKKVPETIDFARFCGPAGNQPFLCQENGLNPVWRRQNAFNRGILFDWGIHYIHNVREIMDLNLPDRVDAVGGNTRDLNRENPEHLTVKYEFNDLPVYWTHKVWGYQPENPEHNIGVFYYGDQGTLFSGDVGWEVFYGDGHEKEKHGDVAFNPQKHMPAYIKMMSDMLDEFAAGIRSQSNDKITNKLEEAVKTTECTTYGDIAYRSGLQIEVGGDGNEIINSEKAKKMMHRDYAKGYVHPG